MAHLPKEGRQLPPVLVYALDCPTLEQLYLSHVPDKLIHQLIHSGYLRS